MDRVSDVSFLVSGGPRDDFSPSRDQCYEMLMGLMPAGRAHQTHSGASARTASPLKSFWYAVAGIWFALESAVTGMLAEFSVASAVSTRDLWLAEYGLPDRCDPAGENLAAKVAASGGTTFEYYIAVARTANWVVDTIELLRGSALHPTHPDIAATLLVRVDLGASKVLSKKALLRAGQWRIGQQRLAEPDAATLFCLFDRMIPAHLEVIVETF